MYHLASKIAKTLLFLLKGFFASQREILASVYERSTEKSLTPPSEKQLFHQFAAG
uniref:hypothetical protein n=1 Tax=Acinetobacter lwoffii TaxID=28090 RepID=UPI0015EF7D12|nr:hypothetical protein [Acinetobacter lwoffii]